MLLHPYRTAPPAPPPPLEPARWTAEGTMLWALVAGWSAIRVLLAAITGERCGAEATLAIATLVGALIALALRYRPRRRN